VVQPISLVHVGVGAGVGPGVGVGFGQPIILVQPGVGVGAGVGVGVDGGGVGVGVGVGMGQPVGGQVWSSGCAEEGTVDACGLVALTTGPAPDCAARLTAPTARNDMHNQGRCLIRLIILLYRNAGNWPQIPHGVL
jgi:hypothetical protein